MRPLIVAAFSSELTRDGGDRNFVVMGELSDVIGLRSSGHSVSTGAHQSLRFCRGRLVKDASMGIPLSTTYPFCRALSQNVARETKIGISFCLSESFQQIVGTSERLKRHRERLEW